MMRVKLSLAAIAALVALAAGGSEGRAWGRDYPAGREEVGTPWHPSGSPVNGHRPVNGPYKLRIEVDAAACYGLPKPYIDHVKVVEKPRSQSYPFPSAVITVYMVKGSEPGPDEPFCAELEDILVKPALLKRPVDDYHLYDGSAGPPRLVVRPRMSEKAGSQ